MSHFFSGIIEPDYQKAMGLLFHSRDREEDVWSLADSLGWLMIFPCLIVTVNRKVHHFQPGMGMTTRASDNSGMSAWFTPPDKPLWPAKKVSEGGENLEWTVKEGEMSTDYSPETTGACGSSLFFPLLSFTSVRDSHGNHGGDSSQTYTEKWISEVQWVDHVRHGDVLLMYPFKKRLSAQQSGVCPAVSSFKIHPGFRVEVMLFCGWPQSKTEYSSVRWEPSLLRGRPGQWLNQMLVQVLTIAAKEKLF